MHEHVYILIVERTPTDPIWILASNSFIQNTLTKTFEKYLQKILNRSSQMISLLATRIMLSSKLPLDLFYPKEILQGTYKDVCSSWYENFTKPLCYSQTIDDDIDETSFQVNASSEFYESVRNKTKIHYSDRLLRLATLISNEHYDEWKDLPLNALSNLNTC